MANADTAAAPKEAKQAVAPVTEAVKNCAGCNKPMKKAKKYYRNGKYYCNQKCWKNTSKTGQPQKKE